MTLQNATNQNTVNSSITTLSESSFVTSVGVGTPQGIITGSFLTAVGYQALGSNTTGASCTAVGCNALATNSTGSENTAIGARALQAAATSTSCVAIGFQAMSAGVTTGSDNIGVGRVSLDVVSSGSNNVAVGSGALQSVTSGNSNVGFGFQAGFGLTTGNNNIYIGEGATGNPGESNIIRIGVSAAGISGIEATYLGGINGATVGTSSTVLVNSSNQLGTIVSSARFKDNIRDMGEASEYIYKLRPVKFTLKAHPEYGQQTGLIAEEVQQIAPQLVVLDSEGKAASVAYHELPALLLNEIQKLRKELDELKNKILV